MRKKMVESPAPQVRNPKFKAPEERKRGCRHGKKCAETTCPYCKKPIFKCEILGCPTCGRDGCPDCLVEYEDCDGCRAREDSKNN